MWEPKNEVNKLTALSVLLLTGFLTVSFGCPLSGFERLAGGGAEGGAACAGATRAPGGGKRSTKIPSSRSRNSSPAGQCRCGSDTEDSAGDAGGLATDTKFVGGAMLGGGDGAVVTELTEEVTGDEGMDVGAAQSPSSCCRMARGMFRSLLSSNKSSADTGQGGSERKGAGGERAGGSSAKLASKQKTMHRLRPRRCWIDAEQIDWQKAAAPKRAWLPCAADQRKRIPVGGKGLLAQQHNQSPETTANRAVTASALYLRCWPWLQTWTTDAQGGGQVQHGGKREREFVCVK